MPSKEERRLSGNQGTFSTLHKMENAWRYRQRWITNRDQARKCQMSLEKTKYGVQFEIRNAEFKQFCSLKLGNDLVPVEATNELLEEMKTDERSPLPKQKRLWEEHPKYRPITEIKKEREALYFVVIRNGTQGMKERVGLSSVAVQRGNGNKKKGNHRSLNFFQETQNRDLNKQNCFCIIFNPGPGFPLYDIRQPI